MDNLINETNMRIQEIIDNLSTIKEEYTSKLEKNEKEINTILEDVKNYKSEFLASKDKIEKMNNDIEGFEADYQSLVDRFKDDELANILVSANKEISLKIEERKKKIIQDKSSMNELVEKAEEEKKKLVKLTAEKKALELLLFKINDAYDYYSKSLGEILDYSNEHKDNLCNNEPIKDIEDEFDNEEFEISEDIEEREEKTDDMIETYDDEDISDLIKDIPVIGVDEEIVEEDLTDDETNEEKEDDLEEINLDDLELENLIDEVEIEDDDEDSNEDNKTSETEDENSMEIDKMPSEKYEFDDLEKLINSDDSLE